MLLEIQLLVFLVHRCNISTMVILVPEKNLEELDAKMKALSPKSLAVRLCMFT